MNPRVAKRRQRNHARLDMWLSELSSRCRDHEFPIDPSMALADRDPAKNPGRRWKGMGLYGMSVMDAYDDKIDDLEDKVDGLESEIDRLKALIPGEEAEKKPEPATKSDSGGGEGLHSRAGVSGQSNALGGPVASGSGATDAGPGSGDHGGSGSPKILDLTRHGPPDAKGWQHVWNYTGPESIPEWAEKKNVNGTVYARELLAEQGERKGGSGQSRNRNKESNGGDGATEVPASRPPEQPAATQAQASEKASTAYHSGGAAGALAVASTGAALADTADERPAVTTNLENYADVVQSTNLDKHKIVLTDKKIHMLPAPVPGLTLDVSNTEINGGMVLRSARRPDGRWVAALNFNMTLDQCQYGDWNAIEVAQRGMSQLTHMPQNPVVAANEMLLFCQNEGDLKPGTFMTNDARNELIFSHDPGEIEIGLNDAGWRPDHVEKELIQPTIDHWAKNDMDQNEILEEWSNLKGLDFPCTLIGAKMRNFASHRDGAALASNSFMFRGMRYVGCELSNAHGHGVELSGDTQIRQGLKVSNIGGNGVHMYAGKLDADWIETSKCCADVPNMGYGAAAQKNYAQLPITQIHIDKFVDRDTKASSFWNDFCDIADIRVNVLESYNAWRDGLHSELSQGGYWGKVKVVNSNQAENVAASGYSGASVRVFNCPHFRAAHIEVKNSNAGTVLFYNWRHPKSEKIGWRSESTKQAFYGQQDIALCYGGVIESADLHSSREKLAIEDTVTGFTGVLDDLKLTNWVWVKDNEVVPNQVPGAQMQERQVIPDPICPNGKPYTDPSNRPVFKKSKLSVPAMFKDGGTYTHTDSEGNVSAVTPFAWGRHSVAEHHVPGIVVTYT